MEEGDNVIGAFVQAHRLAQLGPWFWGGGIEQLKSVDFEPESAAQFGLKPVLAPELSGNEPSPFRLELSGRNEWGRGLICRDVNRYRWQDGAVRGDPIGARKGRWICRSKRDGQSRFEESRGWPGQ